LPSLKLSGKLTEYEFEPVKIGFGSEVIPNPILLPLIGSEAGGRGQGKEKGEKFFKGFMRRIWYNTWIQLN